MSTSSVRQFAAIAIAIALAPVLAARAQTREAEGAYDGDEPRLLARLRADPRGGGHWRVAVELVPDPGWHLYGRDPGEIGLPLEIAWQLPGARFGEIAWPALNLVPCVLPVLAIKLAALAELAARSRREQLRHAAAYTAGIALSMIALAATVAALRAAGASVGWGFQLQQPVFLVAIAALLVA